MDVSVFLQDEIAVWVPLDDARIRVRYLTRAMRAVIRSELTTMDGRATRFDLDQIDAASCAAAVVAWEGIEAHGQPLPCTPENIRLVSRDPLFSETILEAAYNIERHRTAALDEAKKNSPAISGTGSTTPE